MHSGGSERRVGHDEFRERTQGLALDQVEVLLAADAPDRALGIVVPELERADSARGRYLQGEVARRASPSAEAETAALVAYERAQKLPDPPPEAFRRAGLIHRVRGEDAEARRAFQRYLELAPAAADAPLVRAYLAAAPVPPPAAATPPREQP